MLTLGFSQRIVQNYFLLGVTLWGFQSWIMEKRKRKMYRLPKYDAGGNAEDIIKGQVDGKRLRRL